MPLKEESGLSADVNISLTARFSMRKVLLKRSWTKQTHCKELQRTVLLAPVLLLLLCWEASCSPYQTHTHGLQEGLMKRTLAPTTRLT